MRILSFSVYGIAMITKKIEKCVNTGNLTIKNTAKGDAGLGLEFEACGVAGSYVMDRLRDVAIPVKFCDKSGRKDLARSSQSVWYRSVRCKIKQCYNKGRFLLPVSAPEETMKEIMKLRV